jgi:ferredoxin
MVMIQVEFNSNLAPIDIATSTRLLDALLAREVPVKMFCGGRGLCATCHVYVTDHPEALTPQTQREMLRLPLLTGSRPNSRLACQAKVIGPGLKLDLPAGLYVESLLDLESLIGKRSTAPILHPVTGAILVEPQKIILRSLIMQLKDVDFNVSEIELT